jgi:transcriptional regulator with XRE-family HTH domain
MSNNRDKKDLVVSELEIAHLDEIMEGFNSDISAAMSYVRRTQKLTFKQLEKRFSGLQGDTLKRYMHQSYSAMRPIHVVAAYSWITMVPMTAFFHGFKQNKLYRGMNDSVVEALVRIGRLPTEMLNIYLELICNMLSEESKHKFLVFREQIESEFGKMEDHSDLFPPDTLDINAFAIDYYRSIAITVKKFREENNLSTDTISRVLGLSRYQYSILENPNKTSQFPVSIGFRIMKGFQLNAHVNFISEMRQFPEFYKLRQIQHVRDTLVIEALRLLEKRKQEPMIEVLMNLSNIYK